MFSMFKKDQKKTAVDAIKNFSPKGNLIPPKDAQIISGNPAIVAKVRPSRINMKDRKRPLYLKAPATAKHTITDGLKKITGLKSQVEEEFKSGEKVLIEKTISLTSDKETNLIVAEIPVDQEVLVRSIYYPNPNNPLEQIRHPYAFQVATFERIKTNLNPDLPESGNAIKVLQEGFMYTKDIAISDENNKPLNGPIFNHLPKLSDIIQSTMGDCFLLSAIAAILQRDGGADFIMNMMKQEEDGTIVKLFDPRKTPPAPIFIKVSNAYHVINNESAVNHKEPWIHILEKAYAVAGFRRVKGQIKVEHQSFLSMYGEGGFSDLAFTVLTGNAGQTKEMSNRFAESHDPLGLDQKGIALTIAKLPEEQAQQYANQKRNDFILCEALNADAGLLIEWGKYIDTISTQSRDLVYDAFKDICDPGFKTKQEYNGPTSIEEFKKQIQALRDLAKLDPTLPPPPARVLDTIEKHVLQSKRLPGELGSGIYTNDQIEIFNQISALINSDHAVAAATFNSFKEGFVAGLRAKHAYAVTDVFTKNILGKTLMFVRVRNPWGTTGRVYDFANQAECQNEGKSFVTEMAEKAEFDVELSDFTKYVQNFQWAPMPSSSRRNVVNEFAEFIDGLIGKLDKYSNAVDKLQTIKQVANPYKKQIDLLRDLQDFIRRTTDRRELVQAFLNWKGMPTPNDTAGRTKGTLLQNEQDQLILGKLGVFKPLNVMTELDNFVNKLPAMEMKLSH